MKNSKLESNAGALSCVYKRIPCCNVFVITMCSVISLYASLTCASRRCLCAKAQQIVYVHTNVYIYIYIYIHIYVFTNVLLL